MSADGSAQANRPPVPRVDGPADGRRLMVRPGFTSGWGDVVSEGNLQDEKELREDGILADLRRDVRRIVGDLDGEVEGDS